MSASDPEATRAASNRRLGLALVGATLAAIGLVVGANFFPRTQRVEQRIITPIRPVGGRTSATEMLPDLVDATCPSVVRILVPAPAPSPTPTPHRGRRHRAAAAPAVPVAPPMPSGFVVGADGHIITASALAPGDGPVQVQLGDGRTLPADIVKRDEIAGVALLKVDAGGLAALPFGDADFPRTGSWAAALWSPNGSGCRVHATTITGNFLADGTTAADYLRVEPAPPADLPGAPLIDADGRAIAMAATPAGTTTPVYLPASTISRLVSAMLREDDVPGESFGLVLDDLTPTLARALGSDPRGAVVAVVAPDTPAAAAGLAAGDLILSVDNAAVSSASEVARALDGASGPLTLQVRRGGQQITLTLTPKAAA